MSMLSNLSELLSFRRKGMLPESWGILTVLSFEMNRNKRNQTMSKCALSRRRDQQVVSVTDSRINRKTNGLK